MMPFGGVGAQQLLAAAAAVTVFTIMVDIGLGVVIGEFRWVWAHPGVVARGMFAVLVATPVLALAVTQFLELPRAAEIGVVLMAISPGAPVALRRSLDAGGHRSFAPALQILMALLAVVSMPLSIAILDEYYAGHATIGVADIGRQVFVAQILPLGLGMLTRRVFPNVAERLSNRLDRLCSIMFLALALLVLVSAWSAVVGSGTRVVLAVAVITVLALAAGHALGGPMPGTRTAVAVCSAARNPGLALLVATLNDAQPAIVAAIVTYLVVSSLTTLGYALWRRRTAAGPALVQRQ